MSTMSGSSSPVPTPLRLGSPKLEELNQRFPSPNALGTRIEEIKRLEAELLLERTYLQCLSARRHNQDEAEVGIARLPDEVLQTILFWDHASLQPREVSSRNARLMGISHRFMGLVLDYAHLWTTMYFVVPHRNYSSSTYQRWCNFVKRSKHSTVSMTMSPGLSNAAYEEGMVSCFPRCKRLEINAFNNTTPILHSNLFGALEDLTITAHKKEREDDRISGSLLPLLSHSGCRLRRMTLNDCEYDRLTWPSQIASISYSSSLLFLTIKSSLDPHGLAQLIRACPQLRYLSYSRDVLRARADISDAHDTVTNPSSASNLDPPPINLPHLQSLVICGEWDVLGQLAHLQAPNVRFLEIQISIQGRLDSPTEIPQWLLQPAQPEGEFLPGRFPVLRVLTVRTYGRWTMDDLRSIFRSHAELQYFYFSCLTAENVAALYALSLPSVCPYLDTLAFELPFNALGEETLVETLRQVAQPRRRGWSVQPPVEAAGEEAEEQQIHYAVPLIVKVNFGSQVDTTISATRKIREVLAIPAHVSNTWSGPIEIPTIV